jgi:hypothetical protein
MLRRWVGSRARYERAGIRPGTFSAMSQIGYASQHAKLARIFLAVTMLVGVLY